MKNPDLSVNNPMIGQLRYVLRDTGQKLPGIPQSIHQQVLQQYQYSASFDRTEWFDVEQVKEAETNAAIPEAPALIAQPVDRPRVSLAPTGQTTVERIRARSGHNVPHSG
jgi:hypothetical protein